MTATDAHLPNRSMPEGRAAKRIGQGARFVFLPGLDAKLQDFQSVDLPLLYQLGSILCVATKSCNITQISAYLCLSVVVSSQGFMLWGGGKSALLTNRPTGFPLFWRTHQWHIFKLATVANLKNVMKVWSIVQQSLAQMCGRIAYTMCGLDHSFLTNE